MDARGVEHGDVVLNVSSVSGGGPIGRSASGRGFASLTGTPRVSSARSARGRRKSLALMHANRVTLIGIALTACVLGLVIFGVVRMQFTRTSSTANSTDRARDATRYDSSPSFRSNYRDPATIIGQAVHRYETTGLLDPSVARSLVTDRAQTTRIEMNRDLFFVAEDACAAYDSSRKAFRPLVFSRYHPYALDLDATPGTGGSLDDLPDVELVQLSRDEAATFSRSVLDSGSVDVPLIQGTTLLASVTSNRLIDDWQTELEAQAFVALNHGRSDKVPRVDNVLFAQMCKKPSKREDFLFQQLGLQSSGYNLDTLSILLSTMPKGVRVLRKACDSVLDSLVCFERLLVPKHNVSMDNTDARSLELRRDDILEPLRAASSELYAESDTGSACELLHNSRTVNVHMMTWNADARNTRILNTAEIERVISEEKLWGPTIGIRFTMSEYWPRTVKEETRMLADIDILIIPEGEYESRMLFIKRDAVVIVVTPRCAPNAVSERYALEPFPWKGSQFAAPLRLRFFPIYGCSRAPDCHEPTEACGLRVKAGHLRAVFALLANPTTESELILEDRMHVHPDAPAVRSGQGYALDFHTPNRSELTLSPWCKIDELLTIR
ncbi:hypothetical protein FVE85_4295 [Porphyridium purpureum]|uniref:Uncharacterized protein n=1 Tax=Porphyridium purpureum TaxID=35688 RepID=A0A5J4YTQ5_PORPP|nr:hypothetical protein FVE85_4295 [Porphyridium purpureum]|eukprot:POR6807..scf229_5